MSLHIRRREERRNARTNEVTIAMKTFEDLQKKAQRDGLTGLLKIDAFRETAAKEMEFLKREGMPFSVIMMDLDEFRKFNETYGHQGGDKVLKELAGILEAQMRRADLIARYGGEEFIAFLPGTGLDGAQLVGENIRITVQEQTRNNKPFTVSVGVTEYKIGDNLEGMIARADQALYQAKNGGRNQVIAITG